MATTREIGWLYCDADYRVTVRVMAGRDEVRWGDGAHPAEPATVEVLCVREDRTGGLARLDLIEVAEEEILSGNLYALAVEAAEDAERGEYEDHCEREADCRRGETR